MILKKPYAFLIKHFRAIHVVITFLLGIIAYRSYRIFGFFNDYVLNNYTTSVTIGLAKVYVPSTLIWSLMAVIALVTTILVLLIHKKKHNMVYIFMELYYVLFLFGMFYVSSVLAGFETELLSSTASRSIRDILLIVTSPQLIFIIYMGLRSIGFNVKHLNFASDLKELDYSDEDAEEIEISINFEGYKAKRSVRRAIRELIYYIKENKFIVMCITVVIGALLGYRILTTSDINYDRKYNPGVMFNYDVLQVTIGDGLISNIDYKGDTIKDGYYYLALNVNIKNDSGKPVNIDYNNFKLELGNVTITPSNNYSKSFIDYGPVTVPTMISTRANRDIILVYELNANMIKKNMRLQIYNGTAYKDGEYFTKNIYVRINPKISSNPELVGNFSLGDEINLSDSLLKNTKIKFDLMEIQKVYEYEYENCYQGECKTYKDMISAPLQPGRNDNLILALNTILVQDEEAQYSKSYSKYNDFAKYFIQIKYRIGNEVKTNIGINVTPEQKVHLMAFEVPSEITEADIIQLVINIRNKQYIVNLKA